jgi:tetratricopeptide (TPR) repeat protein
LEEKKDFFSKIVENAEPKLKLGEDKRFYTDLMFGIKPKLELNGTMEQYVSDMLQRNELASKGFMDNPEVAKEMLKYHTATGISEIMKKAAGNINQAYNANTASLKSSQNIGNLATDLQKSKEEIKDLKEKIKEQESNSEEVEKEKEEINERLEQEIKYNNKLGQIQLAVDTLKKPAFELKRAKSRAQTRVNFFNKWANYSIIGSTIGFFLYLASYLSIIFFSNRLDTSGYFVIIFPVIFPLIIALSLYRQANIKTKEVNEIDKRLILIHEINQALTATVEINKNNPDSIDAKAEKILERLIDNILTWNKPKEADSLLPKEIVDAVDTIKKFVKTEK